MNKVKYALLLCTLVLLCVGCGKDKQPNDNVVGTEATGVESTEPDSSVTQPTEAIMGVVDSPFDNEDMTEQTEGNEASGNNVSSGGNNSSGGNGQSGTGNGNAGNTGSTGNSGNPGNTSNPGNTGNSGNSGGSNSGGDNTEKPTNPKPTEPGATEPSSEIRYVSYEEYNNMTPAEQVAYYNQFPSMEAFVQWYNEAKAEYDKEHGAIDVGDGNIDIGDIINP